VGDEAAPSPLADDDLLDVRAPTRVTPRVHPSGTPPAATTPAPEPLPEPLPAPPAEPAPFKPTRLVRAPFGRVAPESAELARPVVEPIEPEPETQTEPEPETQTQTETEPETQTETEPEPELEPARRARLPDSDLAPRPLPRRPARERDERKVQRYAPAYVEDDPEEGTRTAGADPDDELVDLLERSKRRRFNWLLVAASVGIGALGLAAGMLGSPKPGGAEATAGADATTAADADAHGGDGEAVEVAQIVEAADAGDAGGADTVARAPEATPELARALEAGKRELDSRRWERALAAYGEAVTLAPGHPRALFGRARALEALGRSEAAWRDVSEVLVTDPTHPQALLMAAELAERLGRATEARAIRERYLAAWPKTKKAAELEALLGAP